MVTTRRNSDDDVPNFEAMITVAVANALPNLTAALRTRITNDIRSEYGPSCQLDQENSGEYMERFTRLASFVAAAARNIELLHESGNSNNAPVAAAARNIELLHESGNSNKRDRDGNRIQNRGQGQQENKSRYDQGQHEYRGRQDQSVEHRGRQDRGQRRSTETLPPPPLCTTCGKPYLGVCYKATEGCFTCGSTQHKVKDYPQGKQKQSLPADFARLPPTTG
ncbi:hypothetical protein Tco_0102587 [Tanacetum coccineum]